MGARISHPKHAQIVKVIKVQQMFPMHKTGNSVLVALKFRIFSFVQTVKLSLDCWMDVPPAPLKPRHYGAIEVLLLLLLLLFLALGTCVYIVL